MRASHHTHEFQKKLMRHLSSICNISQNNHRMDINANILKDSFLNLEASCFLFFNINPWFCLLYIFWFCLKSLFSIARKIANYLGSHLLSLKLLRRICQFQNGVPMHNWHTIFIKYTIYWQQSINWGYLYVFKNI